MFASLSRCFRPSACLLLLLAAAGCEQGPDLPPLAPVTGTITLEGQPLPRGTVQFIPDADRGTTGPTATATINADGTYTLTTAGEPGAMVGWHKVRIISQQEPKDETDTDPASLIPRKYTHPDRSGLNYEVRQIDENQIDIELTN